MPQMAEKEYRASENTCEAIGLLPGINHLGVILELRL